MMFLSRPRLLIYLFCYTIFCGMNAEVQEVCKPAPKVFFITGLVGAGKTTFASILKDALAEVDVFFEPAEKWLDVEGHGSLWDLFLNDAKRWAMTTEIYVSLCRTKALEQQMKNSLKQIIIVDRSIYEDRYVFARMAYENGALSALEWTMYKEWFAWHAQHSVKPSGFIYLRATPKVTLTRMQTRGRVEEKDFPLTLQQTFQQYYEDLFADKPLMPVELSDVPVLTIDADVDFKDDDVAKNDCISKVKSLLGL